MRVPTDSNDEPVGAWVLGAGGLLHDVVAHVLSRQGIPMYDDRDAAGNHASVAVLVEPAGADWEAAAARGVPIVVVVERDLSDERTVALVLQGAEAIIDTGNLPSTIGTVLRVIAGGGTHLSPSQCRALAMHARRVAGEHPLALTRREGEIVESIAAGESVKQTAMALGISAKTVENLQSRLFRKLGARNRAQAVARAHALGLLSSAGT